MVLFVCVGCCAVLLSRVEGKGSRVPYRHSELCVDWWGEGKGCSDRWYMHRSVVVDGTRQGGDESYMARKRHSYVL